MVLSRILKHCKLFFHRKDGASGIEYAIVAAMVAVKKVFDDIVAALPSA